MANLPLQVTVTDARGRAVDNLGLGPWLVRAAPVRARGRVTIALVSDLTMRRLNRDYRRRDYVTDVLSFPAEPPKTPWGRCADTRSRRASALRIARRAGARRLRREQPPLLGDIAIAVGVARRQARAQGHDLPTELRVLALHGLLHLLGYDHERDGGQMRSAEERLRRRAGLPPGLITRPVVARLRR